MSMRAHSRRRTRLAFEISAALTVKLVALVVIWNVWFADREALRVGEEQVARTIYAAPPLPERKPDAAGS